MIEEVRIETQVGQDLEAGPEVESCKKRASILIKFMTAYSRGHTTPSDVWHSYWSLFKKNTLTYGELYVGIFSVDVSSVQMTQVVSNSQEANQHSSILEVFMGIN